MHLLNLVEAMVKECKERRIKVIPYTIHDLQEFCGSPSRNIQKNVAATAVEHFPEVRHQYLIEINSQRPYYQRMFEAIVGAKWYEKRER